MTRDKTKNERERGMYPLPLILPMHGSLNRVIDSNSPWVSTDPVLLRECLAVYRNFRLILLALIAFASGLRRIQAQESSGNSQSRVATVHFETNEPRGSGLQRQSSTLHEAVQVRRDHFTSPISGTLTATNINCEARALAVDTPKQQSLSRQATRAHSPPFSLILKNFDACKFDCKITLLQPADHRTTTLPLAIHRAQIFGQLVAYPPSTRNGYLVAVTLYLPQRKSLHLDVIRAHGPPVQRHPIDFDEAPFHPSNPIATHSDFNLLAAPFSIPIQDSALAPATNAASAYLAFSIFKPAHSYHPQALQSFYRHSHTSDDDKFPDGASFRGMSLLVSTQPIQFEGANLYVCQ